MSTEPRSKVRRFGAFVWKWTRRGLLLGLVLAVVLRIALPLALPTILAKVGESQGLQLGYEKLDLSLLTGRVELWHVDVRTEPKQQGRPGDELTHLEYLFVDVDVSALFTGTLRVHRVEIDGLDVHATRRSLRAGWNYEALLAGGGEPQADEEEDEPETDEPKEFEGFELGLPVEVSAVRVQHVQVHVRDEARAPVFESRLELNVRITDLGHPERAARIEVFGHSDELLDAFEIDGRLRSGGPELTLDLGCRMRGLRLRELGPYLEPLGLRPRADRIGLHAHVAVETRAADEEGRVLRADALVDDFFVVADDDESFALDRLELNAPRLSPSEIVVDTSALRGLRAKARRLADGNLSVAGIDLVPAAAPAKKSKDAPTAKAKTDPRANAAGAPSTVREVDDADDDAPRIDVASLRLEEAAIVFEDEAVWPVTRLEWVVDELALEALHLAPGELDSPARVVARMHSPEILEELRVEGELVPFAPRKTAHVSLLVDGIRPERIRPYLQSANLRSDFQRGHFEGQLVADVELKPDGGLVANAGFEKIRLLDEGELFALESFGVKGLEVDPSTKTTRIELVELSGTRLALRRDATRELHVLGFATGAIPLAPDPRVDPASVAPAPRPESVVVDAEASEEGAGDEDVATEGAEQTADADGSGVANADATEADEIAADEKAADGDETADADPSDSGAPAARGAHARPAPAGPAARVEIARVAWTNTTIEVRDESLVPTLELRFDDLGFELEDLLLGGSPDDPTRAPARMKLWFAADRLAEQLELSGRILSRPGPLDLELDLVVLGRGLTLDAVEPWLLELGLQSRLDGARLDGHITSTVRQRGDELALSLDVEGLRFRDPKQLHLGLERLSMPSLVAGPRGVRIPSVEIEGPRMTLARDADGALLALGLRVPPPEKTEAPGEDAPRPLSAVQSEPLPSENGTTDETAETQDRAAEPALVLEHFGLRGARIAWADDALAEPVRTALTLKASLEDLRVGAGVEPGHFELVLGVEEALEELRVAGDLALDPSDLRVNATLAVNGLRAGPLAPYFPPGLSMPAEDARLAAKLAARFAAREDGAGQLARLELLDLDYRDAARETPWLALERFALIAPRLDAASGNFEIEELVASRLVVDTRIAPDGSLHAMGIAIAPATGGGDAVVAGDGRDAGDAPGAGGEVASGEAPSDPTDAPVSGAIPTGEVALQAPTSAPLPAGAISTEARPPVLPTVLLGKLDLGIDELRFRDERDPNAVPLVASFALGAKPRQTLVAPDPSELPPIEMWVRGGAPPIVRELDTTVRLTPYTDEPGVHANFALRGLRGAGLTEVLPALAETLDGRGLDGGSLEGELSANLLVRRRHAADFDLSGGFGLELAVDRVGLRATPDGDVLVGLQQLNASVKSIRPASGDVHVERIELVRPIFHASKSPEGLHVAGLVLKTPPEGEDGESTAKAEVDSKSEVAARDDADRPEKGAKTPGASRDTVDGGELNDARVARAGSEEKDAKPSGDGTGGERQGEAIVAGGDASATQEVTPNAAAEPLGPEFKLDELSISGFDFSFVDTSVDPPMHLPFSEFDFELKRFSTRTFEEQRPFRFRASIYGGDVELPERDAAGTFVGGLLGSVGALVTLADGYETEERPVFDEILLRGNMSLGPEPRGWTQLRVRALELPAFRGPAAQGGVAIGDGLMDETAMLHFDGEGGVRISSHTNFSYLSLSEPSDGPITSYLKLPMPLDAVLFVLKDEEGDQNIPLNVAIEDGAASLGTIAGAVGTTLGTIIAEAIASSPMRIIGGVIDFAGFGSEPVELTGNELVRFEFAPGEVYSDVAVDAAVEPLLELMRQDETLFFVVQHELSEGDLERCDVLANPPAEDCLDLASNLRRTRSTLLRDRDERATEVRAAYAIGHWDRAHELTESLRGLDREIGRTEAALDRVYEQTRPGAERGRARRARSTALDLAQRRLDEIAGRLEQAHVAGIGARIEVRRPRFGVTPELERGAVTVQLHQRR